MDWLGRYRSWLCVGMPFKLAPRLDAICYIGVQRYFLTICARERRRAFTDSACAVRIVAQLLQTAASEHFSVIAYCVLRIARPPARAGGGPHRHLRLF